MDLDRLRDLFVAVNLFGYALWMSVASLNNVIGWSGSLDAIRRLFSMEALFERPSVLTPLLSRRQLHPRVHIFVLVYTFTLQFSGATLLWISFFARLFVNGEGQWEGFALVGLLVCAICWVSMLVGGLWFAYWIRQEGLQIAQLCLLIWTIVLFLCLGCARQTQNVMVGPFHECPAESQIYS